MCICFNPPPLRSEPPALALAPALVVGLLRLLVLVLVRAAVTGHCRSSKNEHTCLYRRHGDREVGRNVSTQAHKRISKH
jgi:hypothetical protein